MADFTQDKMLDKSKKKLKKIEVSVSEDEEEEDDDAFLEDDFIDLIDDNPIDEESDSESRKRKKSDDEDYDDRLDDEDYDVIEENLGVKVQRKRYKRLKKIEDSEEEPELDISEEKEAIANELFANDLKSKSKDEDERSECNRSVRPETAEQYDEEDSEEESDNDDFIDDDIGNLSIDRGKKKKKNTIADSALQEAHEIFGVDFDYTNDCEEEEDTEDEYTDEEKTKKAVKKNTKKKTIFDIYDASELKRGYFSDFDNEVRSKDIPERMQVRAVPITSATEEELAEEAQWIFYQAFENKTISIQKSILLNEEEEEEERVQKGPQTVPKIQKVLDLLRNQNFEVPFIFFYRKEFILPELDINDLWKIYKFDARWSVLRQRRTMLLVQYRKIKDKQEEHIEQNPDDPLPDNMRLIENEDLNHLEIIQTMDELSDYRKQIVRSGPYSVCRRAGLDDLAKKFGLTPQHFAKNLSKWYQVYEVKQESTKPRVVAAKYVGKQFKTVDEVLKAAKFMVAFQLAREPLIRETVRKMYKEKAMITVQPTKRGIKVIDEHHPMYTMKYLKDKPVTELVGDQYLQLAMAEEDKLITINFSDEIGYTCEYNIDKIKYLYYRDEDSESAKEWNDLRLDSVEMALTKMIIPDLKKELHLLLLSEAKDCVMRACARKMFNWIKTAPYVCEEWDESKGLRVMGVAFVPDLLEASYACIVQPDGRCTDFLKLTNLLKKKHGIDETNKMLKEADMRVVRDFILSKKPHVVVVSGESPDAHMIAEDIRDVIMDLVADEKVPEINVEIMDNEFARVFASSHQGAAEFGNYPEILRKAISLARRLQDPLVEFSQLCNVDDEILCLNFHLLQKQLPKDELLEHIYQEFINRVNEVGVDLNKIVRRSHAANLVQFICGLGPRKARHLVKHLSQVNQQLETRKQLVTSCHLGQKVFYNCAAFIKIDTNNLDDSTETEIELLDGTRVHPEMYKFAKKMAFDALEYDPQEVNASAALEEILESPERLEELDLDAFAEELEKRGFGDKSVTFNNVRAELIDRYKDLRIPYKQPTPEDLLFILTKETPKTFYIGKLVEATVTGIHYRKTKADQLLEQEHPVRHEETGCWQCPLCLKYEFLELPQVWNHLDSKDCPGKVLGVRLRLDNGMFGYIQLKNLSDEEVVNPIEKICIGKRIYCRVVKINVDRFSADLTSKSSDLADVNQEWRPKKDPNYDTDAEAKDDLAEEERKEKKLSSYVPRIIFHPYFRNVTYAQAEMMLQTMLPGEAIFRPSSKGDNHLVVTWKVADDIYQHLDIREEGKENKHILGSSLWIGKEEYEDINEILSRLINPMAAFAAEFLDFKYYKPKVMGIKENAEEILREQKKENPDLIPYIISAAKNYPGSFMLSYLPNIECIHEYISISQNGFKFRENYYYRSRDLFNCFKKPYENLISENGLSIAE